MHMKKLFTILTLLPWIALADINPKGIFSGTQSYESGETGNLPLETEYEESFRVKRLNEQEIRLKKIPQNSKRTFHRRKKNLYRYSSATTFYNSDFHCQGKQTSRIKLLNRKKFKKTVRSEGECSDHSKYDFKYSGFFSKEN